MRMDRYEDEENKSIDSKPSRLNKNQELYSDVYLNNVSIEINNLNDVMKEDTEKEIPKVVKEPVAIDYVYEEKTYDIVAVLDEALKKRELESPRKNTDIEANNKEIDSIMESINEKVLEEKKEHEEDELLSELMPQSDNTEVIPALEEPILDTSIYHNAILVAPPDDETDEYQLLTGEIPKELEEDDTSFVPEKKPMIIKIVMVLGVIITIGIVVVILKLLQVI